MLTNFDEVQKLGKGNVEATLRTFGVASKGFQAIASEVTNYSKKSFEDGTAAVERLMGAKTLEKAIEVQSEYVKSAYEGLVAQATKLGELYAAIAKESYKPFEGYLAKVTPSK
jgi:phasin family protein